MQHSKHRVFGIGCLALGAFVSGCRTATRVTEVPRVDLELSGGNRGYLVGTPPAPSSTQTTRQMIHSDVELPSFYKPTHSRTPVNLEMEGEEPSQPSTTYDTYVVQKGDSLWSIAAKHEVYGRATMWRRLLDANRDVLKSPDQIRPGMTLKIPRGTADHGSTTYGDEGMTYKK